jgi:phage terminase large subunit-like protein
MIAEAPRTERRLRLSDTQCDFVDDPHPFVLFVGGVGAGKTYAGAARALLRRFGVAKPSLGLVVSPSYPMLRDATWRTALDVWAPLIERVVGNEMRLVLKTGDEVIFRSADDPERLRGPNAAWAWIDEAALCHPSTWPITIGRLRQHGVLGEAWLTTTPKGMNWVYEVFFVSATEQTAVHRAATSANPFVDGAFVDSLRSQYTGDFARQELEAEFIADLAGALIEWRWLDEARSRPAAYRPDGGPVVAGLDVAGPGEAETALAIRQGDGLLELTAWLDPDPRGDVLAALAPWRHRGLATVAVDSAGIGHYLARHLEDQGITVRDVNVGEAPTSDAAREQHANLKAELYWALRERFAAGEVAGLVDRALISQLAGLRYEHDSRGRVKIEGKADAVKRGLKSPDRAEALMLCFAPADPRRLRAGLYGLRSTS